VKVRRIVEVDMRLRGAVDDQFEAARELRRDDAGLSAVVEPCVRMLGVACSCPSQSSRLRGSQALRDGPDTARRGPEMADVTAT
jgi:hypothetical protein